MLRWRRRRAKHRARADGLLEHADALLRKDRLTAADRLQVSEKIWGAVMHTLKAIAAAQGWVFRRPRAADSMKSYLGRSSRDGDINVPFRAASDYHTNFLPGSRAGGRHAARRGHRPRAQRQALGGSGIDPAGRIAADLRGNAAAVGAGRPPPVVAALTRLGIPRHPRTRVRGWG